MNSDFSSRLLDWHHQHGRHNLPWQNTQDAYCIWVSEIMLQQTQVTTVIPYYQQFMGAFPNVTALANASEDAVLHHWTGLGYYARARNLHRAAKIIVTQYNGAFPVQFDQVLALPGIGRSTAAAILAFANGQRLAILDGNVKRVLCRVYGICGWPGKKDVENQLWVLAEQLTPEHQVKQYTQAIMDLGAICCTRSKPNCHTCPLQSSCHAFAYKQQSELPHKKPKSAKPIKQCYFLLVQNQQGDYLLQQNAAKGIWGSLWCPPMVKNLADAEASVGFNLKTLDAQPSFRHTFSHYHLDITPVVATLNNSKLILREDNAAKANRMWYNPDSNTQIGLPAPVKALLSGSKKNHLNIGD